MLLLAQAESVGKVTNDVSNIVGQAGVFAVLFTLTLAVIVYGVYRITKFLAPLAKDFVTSTTSLHESLKANLQDQGDKLERIETKLDKGFVCPK